ncbi:dynein axonemal assembly factor 3-like isoform X2 [Lineus longissimus]|uniref:dynein axonemal assembly factor 3-like isoform X2 n=1 Tax=Lineus longissimus TaxID=88925 RepID=UPI002B4D8382
MDGFGTITWWGFSPAIDLLSEDVSECLEKMHLNSTADPDTVHILLIGGGDIRHILKTMSCSWKHKKKKLHFYIIENNLELYARDLLFFSIAMETRERMGLQEKTELFLELYGNTLVRYQSMEYVQKLSTEFIKMVTDFDNLAEKLPYIDMSQLKFKERDMLEAIFKFWRNPNREKDVFDIEKAWDQRLRAYLGTRYDAIPNCFDWDYSMKMAERGAEILNSRFYAKWRLSGVAFEIRDGTYNVPNKTLASGMIFKKEGERLARRGYWGDTLVSPYITFGLECEEKSFFKKSNNILTRSSVDVAEYNMLQILHELMHKEKYIPSKTEVKPEEQMNKGATLTEITEEEEEEEKTKEEPSMSAASPLDLEYKSLQLDDVRISFLPLNSALDLHKKNKYQKLFNIIYFSNSPF